MGITKSDVTAGALNPVVYGQLLAVEQPKAIADDKEFERVTARLEALDFAGRPLTPEEAAFRGVLAALIEAYEADCELPEQPPREMVKFLMEQRGLKQADLVAVLGTRTQVSEIVTGRRGISKAHAKKLAAFFGVGVELFI